MSNFNLVEEIKKIAITIKDLIVKLITTLASMLFMLDLSSDNTPSQNFTIGTCFHPRTLVKLKDNKIYQMQDLPLGAELEGGGKVFAVLKIDNHKKEPLYRIKDPETKLYIYVTGDHYIHDDVQNKWVKVKDFDHAEKQNDVTTDFFSCLITTNHSIKIGSYLFWDWEDDELNNSC
jgi:hypothetical protein